MVVTLIGITALFLFVFNLCTIFKHIKLLDIPPFSLLRSALRPLTKALVLTLIEAEKLIPTRSH